MVCVEDIKRFRAFLEANTLSDEPTDPVVLPAWLYDKAEAHGFNMRAYVKQEPMP